MNGKMTRLVVATTFAYVLSPAAAQAGTRASETKIVPASQTSYGSSNARGQGYFSPGPKDGFKDNKGHDIADIKADDHAAFKRYKSKGC